MSASAVVPGSCAPSKQVPEPSPQGPSWVRLGDHVENLDGRRIPVSAKERAARQGPFPYYGASGVIDRIDGFTHEGEVLLLAEDGANLLSRSKPIAFLARGKIWVNNHAHVVRCKAGHSNKYLAYYLNSIDLTPYVTGTAQPKLSQSMMNKIPIPLIPPEEQQRVVAEIEKQFSRLDEAVANLQRVKANLRRVRASTLHEAMSGSMSIGEQRSLAWHESATLSPKRSAEWHESTVGEIAVETLVGLDRGRDQQRAGPPGERYVKMNNVTMDGSVATEGLAYVSATPAEIARYSLRRGDLLFNTRNSKELVGKTGLVGEALQGALYNNNLMRLRVTPDVVPEFLCMQMCSRGFRSQLEQVKKATTSVAAVYLRDLLPLRVVIPPIPAQLRIVAEVERRLSIVRGVEAEVDANLKRAQTLRQAVLARAFAGEPSSAEPTTLSSATAAVNAP